MGSRVIAGIMSAAAIVGVILIGRGALASQSTSAGGPDSDVDDLARVLVVELSGQGTEAERAGIVHVALNRARYYSAPIAAVIRSQVEDRSEWGSGCRRNASCAYNRELDDAPSHPAFAAMRVFAARVVGGEVPNPIGDRLTFCHPLHTTFTDDMASGSVAERRQALALRLRALSDATSARQLFEQANAIEQVDPRYAWDPPTSRYLPTWAVHHDHGGKAAWPPITLGSTRFA